MKIGLFTFCFLLTSKQDRGSFDVIFTLLYEPGHAKMCLMPYANNKCADQPAHPPSLISAFVVRFLDSIISLVSRSEVVEAITTSRNCSISSSSSSSRSCYSSSISICVFTFSLLKIIVVMTVIIAKIHLRIFSECPKTSKHNSNTTPFKELPCFDVLSKGRVQVDINRKLGQSAHIAYLSH